MISISQYTIFALAFGASASAPGPEVAALLGRSVSGGLRSSGPLALGIVLGKLVLLGSAVAGLAVLVPVLGPTFVVLQYCGAAYLVWLGVKKWRRAGGSVAEDAFSGRVRVLPEIGLGLAMTLSNPIAIAFYLALLPGVIEVARVRFIDYIALATILVAVMVLVVVGYGLAGEVVRRLCSGTAGKTRIDRLSALVFITAGLWIALR